MKINDFFKKSCKLALGVSSVILFCAAAPTKGAYIDDKAQIQLSNPIQDALSFPNNVLCYIKNTNYSDFTNKGPQLAITNQKLCETDIDPTRPPEYLSFIFDSKRVGNGPQVTDVWLNINENSSGQPMLVRIYGRLTVTGNPTTVNPYGEFEFVFSGIPDGGSPESPVMKGYIKSFIRSDGQPELVTYEEVQGQPPQQVAVVGTNVSYGFGRTNLSDWNGAEANELVMAYNESGLLIKNNTNGNRICLNRNDIINQVYQYGVYDNNGDRLLRDNPGYPIVYNNVQGYLSYYGAWVPGQNLVNGDSIKYTDTDRVERTGTLVVKTGMMSKVSAHAYSLEQLKGVAMNVMSRNYGESSNIISWDAKDQVFKLIATRTCNMNSCTNTPVAQPRVLTADDFANSQIVTEGNNSAGLVSVWIDGLGSSGSTYLPLFESCSWNQEQEKVICQEYNTPNNSTILSVWENSLEQPTTNESSQTLYCISHCPYKESNEWRYAEPALNESGVYYITYTFDPNNYILTGSSGPANGQRIEVESPSSLNEYVNVHTLLTGSQYNAILNNGRPNLANLTNGTITSYFQWNSGMYSRFTSIIGENGMILPVSAPLQLVYDKEDGGNSFLQYLGFGNLQGIPGYCVDSNNQPIDDCSQVGSRWINQYNIPNGAKLTNKDASNTYWAKQLYIVQFMNKDNTNQVCSGLDNQLVKAQQLSLPNDTGWRNVAPIIGEPEGINKPSVIDGINQ